MHETVHLFENKENRNRNILLLLIPAIIFATLLAILSRALNNDISQIAATSTGPQILGTSSGELDPAPIPVNSTESQTN